MRASRWLGVMSRSRGSGSVSARICFKTRPRRNSHPGGSTTSNSPGLRPGLVTIGCGRAMDWHLNNIKLQVSSNKFQANFPLSFSETFIPINLAFALFARRDVLADDHVFVAHP